MAINWSAKYPGQIGVDPGWPYGKPRNIVVPGDGTGTPLEAAWVSDLAGWQAALLHEAGITPSGNPDHVGASDYTEAIKALATANFANFTSTPHNWTALQSFTGGYIANNWGVQGETLYVDAAGGIVPKTRTVLMPLRSFVPSWDDANNQASWRFYLNGAETDVFWYMVSVGKPLVGLIQLPHQAVVQSVRAGVRTGGALVEPALEMTVGIYATNEGSGTEGTGTIIWGTPVSTNVANTKITAAPPPQQIDGANNTLAVRFKVTSAGGSQAYVSWVKVVFTDPGPRNF